MGVNRLWSILEPVKRKENLSALSNKTLCVDLSGWICEAQCAKGLKHNVNKPHLRNLFFRLLHLTRLGVRLVFVVDGKPPELKWDAIAKRVQARNGGQFWKAKNVAKAGSGARVGRSHFAIWVRECRSLLNLLGVPCIESEGEAEALCAWLDLHQIVDGCITNDGDAFLYGARTVYRDLCISGKDASVECYKMEEIEAKLNLNRHKLVALGILLGCDYLPQGVSGVGKEIAMKLIKNVNQDNLIDRFYEWAKGTDKDENLSSIEKSVKCKALKDKNFPHPEEFCLKYLEWPEEYTTEKVLLLITYWQMTSSLQHYTTTLVQPERIVKSRVQQKIECYEVEWQNIELGEACPISFVTIETRELFAQAYPEFVEEFNEIEAAKLSKKPKKKKAVELPSSSDSHENEVELLSKQLEDLSVHHSQQCNSSVAQNEKHSATGFSNISADESLQEIIDSILPSISDYALHSREIGMLSRFSGKDELGKFLVVDTCCHSSDNDGYHDDDGDEDDDGDDVNIPWDFNSSQRELVPVNLDHEYESDVDDLYKKLKPSKSKDVKSTPYCLDVSIENHNDKTDKEITNAKPTEHAGMPHETKELEDLKPISMSTTLTAVKSRNNGHGKKITSANNVRKSKAVTVLNDIDLIEIFGSSDEDDNSKSSFSLKRSSHTKTFEGGPDATINFKSRNDTSDTKCLQKPIQYPSADCSTCTDLEENCFKAKNRSDKDLSAISGKGDVKHVNETKRHTNELPRPTRQVLRPENRGLHNTPQCLNRESKTSVKYDSLADVYSSGGYEEVQGQDSGKENADSPFDDYMPAPLSKRLGKQFSAKQRLATLHSISSVTDDI